MMGMEGDENFENTSQRARASDHVHCALPNPKHFWEDEGGKPRGRDILAQKIVCWYFGSVSDPFQLRFCPVSAPV